MAGVKALRKLQLGREATAGTAVAATTVWRGNGTIEDMTEVVFVEEDVGYLSGLDLTYIGSKYAELVMEETPATFEQINHIFEAGIQTNAGSADGAGSGYIYEYAFPETAANTLKTYTIEGGDNEGAEEMEYAYVSSFSLSGSAGEPWMISATWNGRQASTCSFTADKTAPDSEVMLFQKTKLYIDADTNAFGTTQRTNSLLEAELNVNTGWVPVWTADGNLFFSFPKSTPPEVTLRLVMEHDANSIADKADWLAQTPKKIRLLVQGSALASTGTVYDYKSLLIDLAGKWEDFSNLGELNGNDVYEQTFRMRYSSTAAESGLITLVNALSAVP